MQLSDDILFCTEVPQNDMMAWKRGRNLVRPVSYTHLDVYKRQLVTRVTNDTNAISMMFTNLLVSLTKNAFVIVGILIAMICLNYELTLMVLCFVPFIVIFTVCLLYTARCV